MILLRVGGHSGRRRGAEQRRGLRFDFSVTVARDWLKDTVVLLWSMLDAKAVITLALLTAVMLSAVASVYSVHMTREQFAELDVLMGERDFLESEWSRLVIEEGSWSASAWIERSAADAYGLQIAEPSQVRVVE